jgi:hypothetical protein
MAAAKGGVEEVESMQVRPGMYGENHYATDEKRVESGGIGYKEVIEEGDLERAKCSCAPPT